VVEYPVETGRLVLSTAGRDKGKIFMILDIIDEQYVYIVDGDLRTKDRPKKKKIKHLKLYPQVLSGIAGKLKDGAKVFDAEIRCAIRQSSQAESGGA
jgi:ribosomal protein L14E/L6E/L27E